MSTFATRLLDSIEQLGTTQAELARQAGVSAASISDWARTITTAENVKAEPLLRAAAFLQVNPLWLLTGKGSRAAGSPVTLHVAEPAPRFSAWPFKFIDSALVDQLKPDEKLLVEGAWLNAAKSLGFSLGKPAAA